MMDVSFNFTPIEPFKSSCSIFCLGNSPVIKGRIASFTPFPLDGSINHSNRANQKLQYGKEHLPSSVEKNPIDEPGYGSGFHNLSDIITHILQHHTSLDMKNDTNQKKATVSSPVGFNLNASAFSQTLTSSSQNDGKRNKILKSRQVGEQHKMLPGDFKGSLRGKMSQLDVNRLKFRNSLEKGIEKETNFGESMNSTDRLSTRRIGGKFKASVTDDESGNSTLYFHHYIPKSVFTDVLRKTYRLRKSHAKLKLWTASHSNILPHRGSHGKFTVTVSDYTGQRSSSPRVLRSRHNTNTARKSPSIKLRNLREQLMQLKAKLNRYQHFTRPRKRKRKRKRKHNSDFSLRTKMMKERYDQQKANV